MERRTTVLVVAGAMLALMLAFSGTAMAQTGGGDPGNPPPTNPPPGGGGGGGGGVPQAATFIRFGAGFPFGGTTTADFGALPVGGVGGGFSVAVQPQPVVVVEPVVVQPATTMADQIVADTFAEVGLE